MEAARQLEVVDPDRSVRRRHGRRCSGRVWALDLGGWGDPGCTFSAGRDHDGEGGRPTPPPELNARLGEELAAWPRARRPRWAWLAPDSDVLSPGAEALAAPTTAAAEQLLRAGIDVTLRTRGGLDAGAALCELARRHPGRLRVEMAFFALDERLRERWERGAAPLEERLRLAARLRRAGADVVGRVGPLVPMVNDGERALHALLARLAAHGVREVAPEWIEDRPGLRERVEREVSRGQARMLGGWFRMERRSAREDPRQLPERVRRHVLTRVGTAARRARVELVVCRCSSSLGRDVCLHGPERGRQPRQLDLLGMAS